jgi:prepilin-type N-terminal cleavage/methylation domain-containing protein
MVNMSLKNHRGVTLVELMIVVAVLGVVSTGVYSILSKGMQLWQMSKTRAEVEAEVRTVLDILGKDLREAQEATVVIDSENVSQPPYSKISFTDVNGASKSFYQIGRNLYLDTASGTSTLMRSLRNIMFAFAETSRPGEDEYAVLTVSLCAEGQYWGGQTRVYHMNLEKIRIMN